MVAGILTFVYFFLLWYASKTFAGLDNFETVAQMKSRGFSVGIPYEHHLAMRYLDCVPFPALMATIVGLYGDRWPLTLVAGIGAIGLIMSAGLHWTYVDAGKHFPEFVTYNGKLPPAFWTHVIYMGSGFTIVGLLYLCTTHPASLLMWAATIYLVIHVTVGVHTIYKIWTPPSFPYHGALDISTLAPIFGTIILLSGFTWWTLRS
jgi:hypothetical protein